MGLYPVTDACLLLEGSVRLLGTALLSGHIRYNIAKTGMVAER